MYCTYVVSSFIVSMCLYDYIIFPKVIDHVNIIQTLPLLENSFTMGSKEEHLYNQMCYKKHQQLS